MENTIYDRSEQLIRHWWLSLIIGILATAIGFIVLVNPATSYYTIALWLGIVIFMSGILSLVQSLTSENYFVRRGWLILAAVADLVIGLLLMFNSLLSELALPILMGGWLLYRGSAMLAQGFDLRSCHVAGSGWVIFYAAVIIAISLAILWMPTTLGVGVVVAFVAIAFISYGVSAISLGFRLMDVHHRAKELQ